MGFNSGFERVNSKAYYFRFYLHHWLQINLLQPQLCRCTVGPVKETRLNKTSVMKRQFFVNHTVTKSDISALLDSWVTNTHYAKTQCTQENGLSLYFRKNITYLHVDLLWICQVFCLPSNCISMGLCLFSTTHCRLFKGLLCDLGQTLQLPPPGVSTRVTTREHPAAESGTLGEKCPGILPKCRFPRCIQGSFTYSKARTWDRRLYFPSDGWRAEDFFRPKNPTASAGCEHANLGYQRPARYLQNTEAAYLWVTKNCWFLGDTYVHLEV